MKSQQEAGPRGLAFLFFRCYFVTGGMPEVVTVWTEALRKVDFILQREGVVIPVEAKAGENIKATSIKRYEKEYPAETPIIIRLSMRNLSFDGKMLNVPRFMADQLDRLLGLVLQ